MTTTYPSESLPNGYPTTSTAGAYANGQSMEGRPGEYSQPGMPSSSSSSSSSSQQSSSCQRGSSSSDQLRPDQNNAAAHFTSGQDVKYNPATPDSNYSLNPPSARSGTFSDSYLPRSAGYPDGSQRYQANGNPNGAQGNMAQPTSPSSMPSVDGQPAHQQGLPQGANSNPPIPVDPSIAQSSPTYPPHHYSPYPTADAHHMQYQASPMYARPEYGAAPPYSAPHQPMPYGHVATSVSTPPSMAPAGARPPGGGHPLSTVYSFVPIPGTHQQKRPRRRYEEIERMYKCGWNGCEKAYGTLNHLNAHVTMQSHGSKRTPEEFKEIRKEWKARKKEEENQRKADEERQRQQVVQQQASQHPDGVHTTSADGASQQQHAPSGGYGQGVRQLPPIGYAPASGQVGAPYNGQAQPGMEGMPQYTSGQVPYQGGYPPQSPYGQQPTNQMYAHPQTQQPLQSPAGAPPNSQNHTGEQGRS